MDSTDSGNEILAQRTANINGLAALGQAPFGRRFDRSGTLAEIRDGYAEGNCAAT